MGNCMPTRWVSMVFSCKTEGQHATWRLTVHVPSLPATSSQLDVDVHVDVHPTHLRQPTTTTNFYHVPRQLLLHYICRRNQWPTLTDRLFTVVCHRPIYSSCSLPTRGLRSDADLAVHRSFSSWNNVRS